MIFKVPPKPNHSMTLKNPQTSSTLFFSLLLPPYKKSYIHGLQSRISMPWFALDLLLERRNKIQKWLFLPVLHYRNLEYFVETLHWTGSLFLPPESISIALIYMLKKDLCSAWTMASKLVAALQYKRCIALRECSAVNLMTFLNVMRRIVRPTHCPLSP